MLCGHWIKIVVEYQVSFAAEQDIFDIVAYTAERWGAEQARVYSGKLERCMEKLALGEGVYKQLDEFKPPVRVRQCEHHYITKL